MSAYAWFLYGLIILIWGSTWLVITFQQDVESVVSVIYRFGLASFLLFSWCWFKRISLHINLRDHGFIAIQGMALFGFNYWLVYESELYITSGLVATIFSLLVTFNLLNSRLILKTPFRINAIWGGLLGILGLGLLFYPEVNTLSLSSQTVTGIVIASTATYIASLGNIAAIRNSRATTPLLARTAWAMFYGTLILTLVALSLGKEFHFPLTIEYSLSLLYLSIPGSIIAFTAYLKLLTLIGADRAAYSSMLIPVVALLISTLFEGYAWTFPALAGLMLILLGNFLAMRH